MSLFSEFAQLPPPVALGDEQMVICALLRRDVTHEKLAPLAAEHFYADFHKEIWEVSRIAETTEKLAEILVDRGWSKGLDDYAAQTLREWSIYTPRMLRDARDRIVDCAQRRRLLAVLSELNIELRTKDSSVESAKLRLRRFFTEGT